MIVKLNLTDLEKSDIKYTIQKFPDGQQNIVITPYIDYISGTKFSDCSILIISRLNDFLHLELISCAVMSLREMEVEEIHLYAPYILGARSDRKFEEGGNNYLKDVICPIINSLNFKTVTCIDPHSDVLEACIKGFKKISNLELVKFAIRNLYGIISKKGPNSIYSCIFISPDAGASKKIYKLAEQIGYKEDIIICSKDRDVNGKLTKTVIPISSEKYVNDKLYNKDFIIIDDICDGGNTFINIAKELKNNSFFKSKIYLIVTHGIFSKGFEQLEQYFDGIYCTNSYGQLLTNIYTGHGTFDQWIGSKEEQYYPEIKQGFVKQLNVL